MIRRIDATVTTATQGPSISKRWLRATWSSKVARKTMTLTYLPPVNRRACDCRSSVRTTNH